MPPGVDTHRGVVSVQPARCFISGPFTPPTGFTSMLNSTRVMVKQVNLEDGGSKRARSNRYEVILGAGNPILTFLEHSSVIERICCGQFRKFSMDLHDRTGRSVLTLHRPFRCPANLGCCCPYEISVFAPPTELLGTVRQHPGCLSNPFLVSDWTGEPRLSIRGPWFACDGCVDLIFKVYAYNHNQSIGRIIRQWSDGSDHFSVIFPADLDLRMKILLVCASVLLDFVYFENC